METATLCPSLEREALARRIMGSPARLLKRLLDAKACLTDELRTEFRVYGFDVAEKRLYSATGRYFLEYRVRPRPDDPESYTNQQTSMGCVVFGTIVK